MNLHYYTSNSGKNYILEYIESLTLDEQIEAFSVLQNMQNGEFNKLNFKRWQKKIYEVYFYKHNRIFYITIDNNNIYLLHACRKQKTKLKKLTQELLKAGLRSLARNSEKYLYKGMVNT